MQPNNKGWAGRIDVVGQAMLEYVLLTALVVVLGLVAYAFNWFKGVQDYIYDVLLGVSLPIA